MNDLAHMIAVQLQKRHREERGSYLRDLIAHAAASLVLLEGEREAYAAVTKIADAMVGCSE